MRLFLNGREKNLYTRTTAVKNNGSSVTQNIKIVIICTSVEAPDLGCSPEHRCRGHLLQTGEETHEPLGEDVDVDEAKGLRQAIRRGRQWGQRPLEAVRADAVAVLGDQRRSERRAREAQLLQAGAPPRARRRLRRPRPKSRSPVSHARFVQCHEVDLAGTAALCRREEHLRERKRKIVNWV